MRDTEQTTPPRAAPEYHSPTNSGPDLFHTAGRYQVVPRTLCFLRHEDAVLLLRGGPHKWFAGHLNGIGGHIEPGESVLAAAQREVHEECGLITPDLTLRGIIHAEGGDSAGILLFIFTGSAPTRAVTGSEEGTLEWVPLARLTQVPLAASVEPLLTQIFTGEDGIIYGTWRYDAAGHLRATRIERR